MARLSSVENNKKRLRMSICSSAKRRHLKEIILNKDVPIEERLSATWKLAEMPRNSSTTRYRNRCQFSGRARGYHRKFSLSRIALREFGSQGLIPGLIKASW